MTSATAPGDHAGDVVLDPLGRGLRRDALGPAASATIWLASTAPAYGLAAVLPARMAINGVHGPAVLLLAAVPMILVALTFREFNLHEPDAVSTLLGLGTPVTVDQLALLLGLVVLAVLQRRRTGFCAGRLRGPGDTSTDGRIRLPDKDAL